MDAEQRDLIAAALLRRGGGASDGVAAAVARAWACIDHDLAPILGAAGVAAMARRSLHLCARAHPVLAAAREPAWHHLDAAPLRAALTGLGPADAATVAADLLQAFRELLSRMVGPSLTDRLLRSTWDDISRGSTAEDPLP